MIIYQTILPLYVCTYVIIVNLYVYFVGIKEYSNWPTIPQVFIDGEFIGGCDIMLELHRSGELDKILDKNIQEKPVA